MNLISSWCHFGGVVVELAICPCAKQYPTSYSKPYCDFVWIRSLTVLYFCTVARQSKCGCLEVACFRVYTTLTQYSLACQDLEGRINSNLPGIAIAFCIAVRCIKYRRCRRASRVSCLRCRRAGLGPSEPFCIRFHQLSHALYRDAIPVRGEVGADSDPRDRRYSLRTLDPFLVGAYPCSDRLLM